MYQRILVPLDGSDLASRVIPYVKLFAKGLDSPIHLLRVIEPVPTDIEAMAHGLSPDQIADTRIGHARDDLEGTATLLRQDGLKVSITVHEGDPASRIVSEGDEAPDTLIAMSTHVRSGLTNWALGSVTERVLHATGNPMLIVRGDKPEAAPSEEKLRRVIVALDGSSLAEQVLTHVIPLVKALSLEVILTRVAPSAEEYQHYMGATPIGGGATIYTGPYEEFSKEADAQALGYLHGIKDMLREQGILNVEEKLLRGRASRVLVEAARGTPNNLVAMTTHGRSGIGRWLLGSVTAHVVKHSDDPVLVVRAVKPNSDQVSAPGLADGI